MGSRARYVGDGLGKVGRVVGLVDGGMMSGLCGMSCWVSSWQIWSGWLSLCDGVGRMR